MNQRLLLAVTTAGVGVALFTNDARAAGTALDVQSARCTGMGGACTAMIDDSSAIFFNPAGIARGKTFDAQVGITPIAPTFSYKSESGDKTTMPFRIVPPFNAYVAGGITENLSLGIGVFTPYGLSIEWPSGWAGRSFLTKASLATYDFNPTVAATFGPVRFGAGFQLMRATVELQRDINFGSQYGSIDLGAGGWGVGGNAGVQVDVVKQFLTVGLTYRSAVKIDFDGQAHFDNVPSSLSQTIHDQNASTSLVNPDQLALGVASRPIDALVLDADVVWLGWSKFHSIDIAFPDDKSGTLATHAAKNWTGRVNFHLGGEGKLSPNWRVRAGFLYDTSPSPESTLAPDLPDADRLNLAVGGSYHHETGFHVDLGYQYLVLFPHKSTFAPFPGEYGGSVNILGLSIGYATPQKKEAANTPPPPDYNAEPGSPPSSEPAPASAPPTTPAPTSTTPGL